MICFFRDDPAKTIASAAAFSGAGECDKDVNRGTHDDEALRILHGIQMKRSRTIRVASRKSGQHVSKTKAD